jgi:hypothetical protein
MVGLQLDTKRHHFFDGVDARAPLRPQRSSFQISTVSKRCRRAPRSSRAGGL